MRTLHEKKLSDESSSGGEVFRTIGSFVYARSINYKYAKSSDIQAKCEQMLMEEVEKSVSKMKSNRKKTDKRAAERKQVIEFATKTIPTRECEHGK